MLAADRRLLKLIHQHAIQLVTPPIRPRSFLDKAQYQLFAYESIAKYNAIQLFDIVPLYLQPQEPKQVLRNLGLLFMAIVVSAQSAPESIPKPYDVQEAYKVYAAALALDHAKGELLIGDTTLPFKDCLDSHSDELVDAAIADYKRVNESIWQLQRIFKLKSAYKLLSPKEIKDLQKPDPIGFNWTLTHGKGIRRFSAVGFNSDKTIAFVEADFICGGMCGHGQSYVLQKRNGRWQKYLPDIQLDKADCKEDKDGALLCTVKGPIFTYCSWNY
ncbi:MAG TPA: hypothetical protein VHA06_24135 [Candidatus Angelobacter sp.]|nr:hypothetical protein [Candidatus Angelobacter sp.]